MTTGAGAWSCCEVAVCDGVKFSHHTCVPRHAGRRGRSTLATLLLVAAEPKQGAV